jgi:dihydroorotate dehydrogenase
MSALYRNVLKPFLFRMDAENAHHLMIGSVKTAGRIPGMTAAFEGAWGVSEYPELAMDLWGMHFANPVGLAAGLDKNGESVKGFSRMGFGFMEVGTVTPKPQSGNERPRAFRLPEDEALINRMGFNNCGVEQMAQNLQAAKPYRIPVAVNIGKNKATPNFDAIDDYRAGIRGLYPLADCFVVNISSPNTPDLRKLQHGDELTNLLAAVVDEMNVQKERHGGERKAILVKIAPDLTVDELESTAGSLLDSGVSGIVATNTTLARNGLTSANRTETGGLSGKPLKDMSTDIIRRVYRITEGKLPIIGCGGIFTAQDAYEKILAGASLVEIYTSLIYLGPAVNKAINHGLLELLRRDGYSHLSQAIGAGNN